MVLKYLKSSVSGIKVTPVACTFGQHIEIYPISNIIASTYSSPDSHFWALVAREANVIVDKLLRSHRLSFSN